MVISVFTTVSTASGFLALILCAFASPSSENFIGTVALHPVPTITPATTRELGKDLTQ
jgi:hypothetical protein